MPVRVWELARRAGLRTQEVQDRLSDLGVEVGSHATTVDETTAERFEALVAAERAGEEPERIRVYELARSIGMGTDAVMDLLDLIGVRVSSPVSTVWEFDADRLVEFLSGPRHGRLPDISPNGDGSDPVDPVNPALPIEVRTSAEPDGDGGASEVVTPQRPREEPAGVEPPTRGRDLGLLLRIAKEVEGQAGPLVGLFVLSLLATPLMLLTPVPVKIAVDSVLGGQPLPGFLQPVVPDALATGPGRLLVLAAALQIVVVLASQLQEMTTYVLGTATGERITLDFRAKLFRRAQRLSLTYHDRRGVTDPLYRIEYDAPSLRHTVDTVIPFTTSAIMLVVVLYVTARIDPQLAVVAVGVAPVLFVLSRRHVSGIRDRYRDLRELETRAMGVVQEVLSAVRVVKAYGREDDEQRRFRHRYGDTVQAQVELSKVESAYGLWINVTTAVGTALVLYLGVRNVQLGRTSLGDLLVVLSYLAALYGPLKDIAQRVGDLQSSFAGAERAFHLLDELPEVRERPDARPIGHAEGALTFDRVTFGYDPDRPVLRDVSLHIEPGARVGIVGRTGAGKTTLVSLIMRFYDPQGGRVLLDGDDLRDLRLADVRGQFSLMLQEPVLFSTSIADNIRYARPGASDADLRRAAEAADADRFIRNLPDGYDTLVGERGMLLSGGQRQRISLARAFLRDAPVLILDEPTSSVDRTTESAILAALDRLMEGRTTLMIAHRLSTLESCDALIEISGSRVRLADRHENASPNDRREGAVAAS